MQFMPWSQDLEIGIGEVDEQHQWLVNLTNQLHTHMNEGQLDPQRIGDCLEQLMDYTMNHFIAEEELLKRHGYPDTDEHIRQHNQFCQQVMALQDRHEAGERVGNEAVDLLKNWLINHITRIDRDYVDYFRANNITV
ncbi:MAG: bacteriohemerythrin [Thiopseudomonas sp.]|nr:bacteriohemerythrin [Gammaproteobacteria bacterium]